MTVGIMTDFVLYALHVVLDVCQNLASITSATVLMRSIYNTAYAHYQDRLEREKAPRTQLAIRVAHLG